MKKPLRIPGTDGAKPVEGLWVGSTAVSDLKKLEDELAAMLARTAGEVDHAECFDQEQRAEVYAILSALRADTQAHRTMLDRLAAQDGGAAHA